MPRLPFLIVLFAVVLTPLASDNAESSACVVPKPGALPVEGSYPDHHLSPVESLKQFDAVFLGEVLVPTKPCSLGFCAGIKVLNKMKGNPGDALLIQVAKSGESPCMPTTFATKGARWLVFANQGTSPRGQKYFYTGDDGPTFATRQLPDFAELEGRYQVMRAQLDHAIEAHLGRL